MSRNVIRDAVAKARSMSDDLVETTGDSLLEHVQLELRRIATLIDESWPLQSEDKENIRIGVYALRNLADLYPELADQLQLVQGYIMKNG